MKRLIMILTLFILLSATPVLAAEVFPDLELKGQLSSEQAAYLGATDGPLKVSDINADFLLVEVFSMYCPICQRDAPEVNDMERKIMEADPEGSIKLIGIGAGNTPFEVDFYAKKFQVGFPLFHDADFIAHQALNNVGTPAFYLVDLNNERKILVFHEGEIDDADALLKIVLDAAGK